MNRKVERLSGAAVAGTASPVRHGFRPKILAKSLPKILYVTPETTDFVKSGGLGDVSAALPRALRSRCDVRVLIPAYRQVLSRSLSFDIVGRLPGVAGIPPCDIAEVRLPDGLIAYAIIAPELYDRDGTPYGDAQGHDWSDSDVRFARLSLAAAEIAGGRAQLAWQPDLMHLHDWPTAIAAGYAAWRNISVPSLLTIHNLAYQGLFARDCMDRLGIPPGAFQIDGVEFHGKVSFLKAGIAYATEVSTVSATYADEITTPEFGCGLDGLLKVRAAQGRLTGIINGIDDSWDPSDPGRLSSPFDAHHLKGKAMHAAAVRSAFDLAVSQGPLFAVVSRLVHQKGLDLMIGAAESVVRAGGQIAIMGQGDAEVESAIGVLAKRHPGRIALKVGFDEAGARAMFAGSDFLLMPSRFEPCGLSQMYAQRFGSLPIARKTGGLADSIEDGLTGFLFRSVSVESCRDAIGRALNVFDNSTMFAAMRRLAMSRNFSWTKSAATYQGVYERAIASRRAQSAA